MNISTKNKKAFTIAELVIVLFVSSVLLTMGIMTYRSQQDYILFNRAVTKVSEMIQSARNMSLSSQPVYYNNSFPNLIAKDGYGVFLKIDGTNSNVILFANMGSGDTREAIQNDDDPHTFNTNSLKTDIILEKYKIPNEVVFELFQFEENNSMVNKWSINPLNSTKEANKKEAVIIFKPPMAETEIYGPKDKDNNFIKGQTFSDDNDINSLNTIAMKFINIRANKNKKSKCMYVEINRIKTFPEIKLKPCNH